MTTKTYFVKISWTDPQQPLVRLHENTKVDLDLTKDEWTIFEDNYKQIVRNYGERRENLTIDFMIEAN